MRTLLLLFALAGLSGLTSQAHAQLSGALVYGDDTEFGAQLGYGFELPFAIAETPVSARASVTAYLPDSESGGGIDVTAYFFDVAVEGLYSLSAFVPSETFDVYAVGGLNYSYARVSVDTDVDVPGFEGESDGDGDLGLNVGAGATYERFFGELRLGLGGFEQLMLGAGIRF